MTWLGCDLIKETQNGSPFRNYNKEWTWTILFTKTFHHFLGDTIPEFKDPSPETQSNALMCACWMLWSDFWHYQGLCQRGQINHHTSTGPPSTEYQAKHANSTYHDFQGGIWVHIWWLKGVLLGEFLQLCFHFSRKGPKFGSSLVSPTSPAATTCIYLSAGSITSSWIEIIANKFYCLTGTFCSVLHIMHTLHIK